MVLRKTVLLLTLLNFTSVAQVSDTIRKLPFAIAHEKRLSEEDLSNKKEGVYVTGVPDLSSDPLNGFGYGGEGSLFFNGKRSDPFFAYTAYRAKIDLALFNTTRSQREVMVKVDIPYVFNTKWRLRFEVAYEQNPNLLFFGTSSRTLRGLSYFPHNDPTLPPVTNATFSDYEQNALSGDFKHFNSYIKDEFILNISAERSFMDGRLRLLLGYEVADFNIKTFAGRSLILDDFKSGLISGVGRGLVSIQQTGIIWDTRDLETDPGKGIFAELTNELSLQSLGSAFNFNKTFFHINFYQNLIRNKNKKLVLALRIAGGYTEGGAPFFEFQDQWSSEGSIEGLGGAHTLRGYKQSRFLDRVMTFNNLELRYRFAQLDLLKQHFAFVAVPFVDAGGVWNKLSELGYLNNYRYSEGLGLRIVWNVNTVLRFDYALSGEDRQFFFNLAHAF